MGLGAVGCADTELTPDDDAISPFIGRKLSNETGMMIHADGTLTSTSGATPQTVFDGVWDMRRGQYCSTITIRATTGRRATDCQNVTVDGDQVMFEDLDGRRMRWKFG